ncbi:Ubiquitin-conjugating enzyme E2 J2-like [Oopsacas minuta]|uniref:Ubiquitin-conjugating enzyme E2 J2-like n=1 Tax=Oopsacas minuta TaxID=111878 RepID=A0AAV7KKA9_9METZ|nr:Ubiquitin-conjugating enzyme E2 J2-like [Oopsacas minuta]
MTDDECRLQYHLSRATKRLNRDIKLILSDPIPGIQVAPNEDDILDWHFTIQGKKESPYEDGVYHGKLVFPPNFPFAPPKILFLTPNGRFKVNKRICFSLSDFHPEEWKPAYSVTAVLRGVYEFMHECTDTIGSIDASESERKQLALDSNKFNLKNIDFCRLFPNFCGSEPDKYPSDPNEKIQSQHELNSEHEKWNTDPPVQTFTDDYQKGNSIVDIPYQSKRNPNKFRLCFCLCCIKSDFYI